MAPCGKFVSLLRSCYSTQMRFFRDSLSTATPVRWYFLPEGSQWVGLENVFNSRNWYGGTQFWPDLGEVEGSPRTWVDGSGAPALGGGPFGDADQWQDGAYLADAINYNACFGPRIPPWIEVGWYRPPFANPPIRVSPTVWAVPMQTFGGRFVYAVGTRQGLPRACGYPGNTSWVMSYTTDGSQPIGVTIAYQKPDIICEQTFFQNSTIWGAAEVYIQIWPF